MFLVLMIHYIPLRAIPSAITLQTDFYGTIFNLELRSISFVCVNCFILISGYFGIVWKSKSFWNYIYQILFWTIVAYFVAVATDQTIFETKQFFWKIINFMSDSWFRTAYLGLFMFAPILNSFIDKCSQKDLGKFIVFFYLFSTIFGYILQSTPEFHEGMSFVSFFGLYFIGAYIRRYDLKILSLNKYYDLAIYIGLGIGMTILSAILLKLEVKSSIYGYMNPVIILESVYLFLFFKKLDLGYNKFVNWVAASAFAVYLFHMNSSLYSLYQEICKEIQLHFTYSFFVAIGFMICVFITAVLIDKIRIWSFNIIYKQKQSDENSHRS